MVRMFCLKFSRKCLGGGYVLIYVVDVTILSRITPDIVRRVGPDDL